MPYFQALIKKNLQRIQRKRKENESNFVVNGPAGRYVTLSCQTCRKLKRHKEIETDLYQCVTCKRQVDLRRVSLRSLSIDGLPFLCCHVDDVTVHEVIESTSNPPAPVQNFPGLSPISTNFTFHCLFASVTEENRTIDRNAEF